MLDKTDRTKVETYIDSIISELHTSIERYVSNGMKGQDLIDSTIKVTVNKITPESKMIMSSVYDMLSEKTLAQEIYQNPLNKASFYEKNLHKVLSENLLFEVPNHIDYTKSEQLFNHWVASGAVVVAGGVVSIVMNSAIPVIIAIVLAGIMLVLLKKKPVSGGLDVSEQIDEYLKDVAASLKLWITEIEKRYDAEVEELEKGMI